jgi:LysM repeat protein
MTMLGTDDSGYQPGNLNLSGLQFAIIKASEGTTVTNPNYPAQVAEIRADKLLLGTYHYADGADPVAEAQFYVRARSDRVAGDIQCLDVERPFTTQNADPVGWSVAWLNEVFRLSGNMPLIYLNYSDRHGHDWSRVANMNVGLWDAEYNPVGPSAPTPWPFVAIWQNSDKNQTGGDSDVFEADASAWIAYGSGTHTPPTPTPPTPPTPKPTPPPIPAPRPAGPTIWIVDPGNSMSYIAGQVGVSLAALEAANPGVNPNLIYPGQRLNLPAGAHW